MIHIAICDSDNIDLEQLKSALQNIMDKTFIYYEIEEYDSGEKLLSTFKVYDLVFLDVMLKDINGVEIGKLIYRKNRYTKIIYQTSYIQYCQDAVNKSHAFAFLEKPIQMTVLEEQIKEFMISKKKVNEVQVRFQNVKYVLDGTEVKKPILILPVDEIIYFEYIKSQKKIVIITESQRFVYSGTMKDLEEKMNPLGFEICCRGLLINIEKVVKIKGYTIFMNNGQVIPLSQKRVRKLKERINEFLYNEILV